MKYTLAILIALFCVPVLHAADGSHESLPGQKAGGFSPDSTLNDTSRTRSGLLADSASASDTTAAPDTSAANTGIDTVVTYSATDSIVYSISNREMKLYKKGNMQYRDFKLDAGHIAINWDNAILTAEGVKDTADKIVEQPIFTDAGETYDGSHVSYDFRSKKGTVSVANTTIDKGHYHGQIIKKY